MKIMRLFGHLEHQIKSHMAKISTSSATLILSMKRAAVNWNNFHPRQVVTMTLRTAGDPFEWPS